VTPQTAQLLRRLAEEHETAAFYRNADGSARDPAWFLHRGAKPEDCEAMAFVASALSFGRREAFLRKISSIEEMCGGRACDWLRDGAFREQFPDDGADKFYRFFSYADMRRFFARLGEIIREEGSLGGYVRRRRPDGGLAAARVLCGAFAPCGGGIVPKTGVSACKRVCMFLRWMARDGSPVDLGLWKGFVDKTTLAIPLDVHVLKQARSFGLTRRKDGSMRTALEITAALREVFPEDPLKGDFALFGADV